MKKISLYLMLVIAYLGLAKALSPSEIGVNYLPNEKSFSKLFPGSNVSAILTDMHATGFLIKTYYQKYRVIYGFQHIEEVIVRTSRDFALKNKKNIGMSLFRHYEKEIQEETLPLPPGSNFIGDREFGQWKTMKSGRELWVFYRAYKNLPRFFGWGKFKIDKPFYEALKQSQELDIPFYGTKNEFGETGKVTRKYFPHFFKSERQTRKDIKTLWLDYLKENF